MQGIYGLFASDECLYIGQSVDIERRVSDHLRKLEGGRHSLKSLQSFATRSAEPLEWRVLEEVEDRGELSRCELNWFEKLSPRFYGYRPSAIARYTPRTMSARKPCAICSQEFTLVNPRQKFCSPECYYEGRKRRHTCARCGVEFESFVTDSEYCSLKCYYDRPTSLRECERCGREFESRRARYCGCAQRYPCHCVVCGESFESSKKNSRFCSHACRFTLSHELTCVVCGATFEARHRNARYCGDECRSHSSSATASPTVR